MPRPGQGSSGGPRSSSSHSAGSRFSSGHRMSSSSSRPGQSSSGFSGFSSSQNSGFGGGPSFGPTYRRRYSGGNSSLFPFLLGSMFGRAQSRNVQQNFYGGNFGNAAPGGSGIPPVPPQYGSPNPGNGPRKRSGMSAFVWILAALILFFLIFGAFGGCSSGSSSNSTDGSIGVSTINREKLDTSKGYNAQNIVDELGWFDNVGQTEQRLRSFYDKTGVQPYIVLKEYDPSLKTDAQKSAYAQEYYDEYITDEDTFLYMYFAEPSDSQVGYMETVNGKNVGKVMDPEAVNIFWNYLDKDWTSNQSTDDLFVGVFNDTADRIMTRTTTSKDVMSKAMIVLAVVAVGGVIIAVLMVRRKHEREKAEETQRILSTPLNASAAEEEDLLDKYNAGSSSRK